MKYSIILLAMICLMTSLAQAQDMERMKRDIEVAENILASLWQEEGEARVGNRVLWGSSGSIEGSYIEDFGLLFTIAPRFRVGAVSIDDGKVQIRPGEEGIVVLPDPEEKAAAKVDEAAEQAKSATEASFRQLVETFATDYAYLLRELPEAEKIMIRYGSSGNRLLRRSGIWTISGSRQAGSTYSAVLQKSDLNAFQAGRLTENQLRDRIEFVTTEAAAAAADRDLEILSNIFSTLYDNDAERTISLQGMPRYEKIPGLGAIIYLRAGPPGRGSYVVSGYATTIYRLDKRGVAPVPPPQPEEESPSDLPELATRLTEAFPAFLEELKEHIVEYGSIVRSLEQDEALIFQVDFFDCRDCNILPEKMEITAKKSVLTAYRKGELDLRTAVGRLKVEKEE